MVNQIANLTRLPVKVRCLIKLLVSFGSLDALGG